MLFRKKGTPESEEELVEHSLAAPSQTEEKATEDQPQASTCKAKKTARKAAKAADKAERKAAKSAKKTARSDAKAAKKTARQDAKQAAAAAKVEKIKAEASVEPRITPKKAKNAIAVAKVLAPVVVPVLAPLAGKAVATAREAMDRRRARKLGVDVDAIGEYTGRGAALHARIAGVYDSVSGLRDSGAADDIALADQVTKQLHDLTLAVKLAERMPAPRRKEAHRAVNEELTELEARVLKRLGV